MVDQPSCIVGGDRAMVCLKCARSLVDKAGDF